MNIFRIGGELLGRVLDEVASRLPDLEKQRDQTFREIREMTIGVVEEAMHRVQGTHAKLHDQREELREQRLLISHMSERLGNVEEIAEELKKDKQDRDRRFDDRS